MIGVRARDVAWSTIGQAALRLGIVGAALGLFLGLLRTGVAEPLVTKNALGQPDRAWLLAFILGGGVLGAIATAILVRSPLHPRVERTIRAARIASPLALVPLVPILGCTAAWMEQPLLFLSLLAVFGVLAQTLGADAVTAIPPLTRDAIRASLRFPRWFERHGALAILLVCCTAFSIWCAHYTLLGHRRLITSAFDLGIYDNLMFTAMKGHPFRSPVLFGPDGGNYLANHAEFVIMLFLPIYALRPGPETLLLLQAIGIGFAAVPLYAFARVHVGRAIALVVALSFLAYGPLHGCLFYDFHWIPLAVPIHFTLYWALSTRRYKVAIPLVLVLFSVREDVAVGLTVLGVFLALTGARVRFGAGLAVASVAWFVIDKFGIMMHAGSWWFADMYKELMPVGEHGYGGVIKTIITNPAYFLGSLLKENKLVYVLHLFAPLALLPGRYWYLLALAMPGFFFTLMTTGYAPTLSIAFQYTTHWIPYLFGATVLVLRLLAREQDGAAKRGAATVALACCVGLHTFSFGGFFQRGNFDGGFQRIRWTETEQEKAEYATVKRVAALIPADASVSALEHLNPHVSTRETAYTLRESPIDADYVMLKGGWVTGGTKKAVETMFKRGKYGLVKRDGDIYLFKHGVDGTGTDEAVKALGLTVER